MKRGYTHNHNKETEKFWRVLCRGAKKTYKRGSKAFSEKTRKLNKNNKNVGVIDIMRSNLSQEEKQDVLNQLKAVKQQDLANSQIKLRESWQNLKNGTRKTPKWVWVFYLILLSSMFFLFKIVV